MVDQILLFLRVPFASLILAKKIFVPITVVGYLYLGLTYGGLSVQGSPRGG